MLALPGVIPTHDVFTSDEQIKTSAPQFYALVESARRKMPAGKTTWDISIFAAGMHDLIRDSFFKLTHAILTQNSLKQNDRKAPRLLTISTASIEQNMINMHAVMKNPARYVSEEMEPLGEFLFGKNIFEEDGITPRPPQEIKKTA